MMMNDNDPNDNARRRDAEAPVWRLPRRYGGRRVNRQVSSGDRFIPQRVTPLDHARYALGNGGETSGSLRSEDEERDDQHASSKMNWSMELYKDALRQTILDGDESRGVLRFSDTNGISGRASALPLNSLKSSLRRRRQQHEDAGVRIQRNALPSRPTNVLDLPDLSDDFYINVLSWSDTNTIAVGLLECVYVSNLSSGRPMQLCRLEGDVHVSSVEFVNKGGRHLAVGSSNGCTLVYDMETQREIRRMGGHIGRVNSLCWNGHNLSSGGRDGVILNHDIRVANHIVGAMVRHEGVICQLKQSPDMMSLASGGNDDRVCVWDARRTSLRDVPCLEFLDHVAAVKALAWSPHEWGLLASGGGNTDQSIKFWNSQSGKVKGTIRTGAQVCGLMWSSHRNEVLSSHGYGGNNLSLWRYPSLTKVKDFECEGRPLHMEMSPDGESVGVAMSDEKLCFWRVFEPKERKVGCGSRKSYGRVLGADDGMSDEFWRSMQIR